MLPSTSIHETTVAPGRSTTVVSLRRRSADFGTDPAMQSFRERIRPMRLMAAVILTLAGLVAYRSGQLHTPGR